MADNTQKDLKLIKRQLQLTIYKKQPEDLMKQLKDIHLRSQEQKEALFVFCIRALTDQFYCTDLTSMLQAVLKEFEVDGYLKTKTLKQMLEDCLDMLIPASKIVPNLFDSYCCPSLSLIIEEARVDVNQQNNELDTILSAFIKQSFVSLGLRLPKAIMPNAVDTGIPHILKFFGFQGCDWNQPTLAGLTPTHWLCLLDQVDDHEGLVASALAYGANLNDVDMFGRTPLHLATMWGNANMVRALINRGANKNLMDRWGRVPLDYALQGTKESREKCDKYHKGKIDPKIEKLLKSSQYKDARQVPDVQANLHKVVIETWPCFKYFTHIYARYHYLDDENFEPNKKELLEKRGSLTNFIKSLLTTKYVGPLQMAEVEEEIKHQVDTLVRRITSAVSEMDERFSCESILSGSLSEGTKVGLPEEFDYNLNLKMLSSCTITERWQTLDELSVFVKPTSKHELNLWKDYIDHKNGTLDAENIHRKMMNLIVQVLSTPSVWEGLSLMWVIPSLGEPDKTTTSTRSKSENWTFVFPVILEWTGSGFPGMLLSVDLMPSVEIETWPENSVTQSTKLLADEEKKDMCYIVIKKFRRVVLGDTPRFHTFRLSGSKIERYIMQRMPRIPKLAYMLCKIIVDAMKHSVFEHDEQAGEFEAGMEPFAPVPSSYDLKNALFFLCDQYLDFWKSAERGDGALNLQGVTDNEAEKIAHVAERIFRGVLDLNEEVGDYIFRKLYVFHFTFEKGLKTNSLWKRNGFIDKMPDLLER